MQIVGAHYKAFDVYKCDFCQKTSTDIFNICMNTRDMEDKAISADPLYNSCWEALKILGGAEKGLRYVQLNREHNLLRSQ